MSENREALIETFLRKHEWHDADRGRLAGDASFRKYDRLKGPRGPAVLMDAPPPHEDVRPFARIARHLFDHGFGVPEILAEDHEAGLLLLEDLGDDTYTRLLARGHSEHELYALAVDALIALHRLPARDAIPEGVSLYGHARLLEEVSRINSWYRQLVKAAPLSAYAERAFGEIWAEILARGWKVPSSLVLFDFHIDNLMLIPGREGLKSCGILDFQDAVSGPITYDLMSLLEDARRDIDPALVSEMKDRYLAAFPTIRREDFDLSWAVMAAQRHVRVIGTFARLKLRDNKPHYLVHMDRLWRYMDACLAHPALKDLKEWFDTHYPADLRVVSE